MINILRKMQYLILILIIYFPVPAIAGVVVCGQTITENTKLTENLSCPPDIQSAIVIGAPNITLDLGGHVLKGSALSTGVIAQDTEGVIIRNGTIDGFNDGIFLIDTLGATLEELTIRNSEVVDPNHFIFGVHVDNSKEVVVRDSLFEFPSVPHKEAVDVFGSDVVVSNIEVRGGGAGVSFSFANTCDPVHYPSNGKVINSRFSGIHIAGIYIACSNSVLIKGNDISSAPGVGAGIQGEAPFEGAVTGLTVENNNIHDNVLGVEFRGVDDSVISNNIISANSAWGIAMRPSLGCLTNEPDWECHYSNANEITGNTVLGNGTDLYCNENSKGHTWELNSCETKQGVDIPECPSIFTPALLLLKSGPGIGTVVSNPAGINCGSSCLASFSKDSPVSLTAIAGVGSVFSGWSGNSLTGTGGFVTTTTNPLTVSNVTATQIITANFSASPINGVCGSSDGGTFTMAPTTGFCITGNASSVTGTGPWSWSCTGQYGGTNSDCSAQKDLACITLYEPVCGTDGKTYGNSCEAGLAGIPIAYQGVCKTPKPGDIDGNSTVTIAEVQSAINMFLGINNVHASVDTDSSGSISIAEVQKVINGFLGL